MNQEKAQRSSKGKPQAEVMKKFRLTRFGWERRRARLRGWRKRNRSWASKRKSRTIEFTHRGDLAKLYRQCYFLRLKVRDFPREINVNLNPKRALLGSHFG